MQKEKNLSSKIIDYIKAHGWDINADEAGDLYAMFHDMANMEKPLLQIDKEKFFMTASQKELMGAFMALFTKEDAKDNAGINAQREVIMSVAGYLIVMGSDPVGEFKAFTHYVVDVAKMHKADLIKKLEEAKVEQATEINIPVKRGKFVS